MLVEPTASLSTLPPTGARIGQYEIIRELGRGGMGAVFAARDTKLGRKVAIKFLHSDATRPGDWARFLREARATARCTHENIVVIHDVGERGAAAVEACDEGEETATCNGNGAGAVQCQVAKCGDGYLNALADAECDPMAPTPNAPCAGAQCNLQCLCVTL